MFFDAFDYAICRAAIAGVDFAKSDMLALPLRHIILTRLQRRLTQALLISSSVFMLAA